MFDKNPASNWLKDFMNILGSSCAYVLQLKTPRCGVCLEFVSRIRFYVNSQHIPIQPALWCQIRTARMFFCSFCTRVFRWFTKITAHNLAPQSRGIATYRPWTPPSYWADGVRRSNLSSPLYIIDRSKDRDLAPTSWHPCCIPLTKYGKYLRNWKQKLKKKMFANIVLIIHLNTDPLSTMFPDTPCATLIASPSLWKYRSQADPPVNCPNRTLYLRAAKNMSTINTRRGLNIGYLHLCVPWLQDCPCHGISWVWPRLERNILRELRLSPPEGSPSWR